MAERPARIARLRARYPGVDHLVRAASAYQDNHGNHYAAAITYFSVLAVVPLLMVAFSVLGFVLAGNEELLADLQDKITTSAPEGIRGLLSSAVDQAVTSKGTVGIIGLLGAAYSGMGWMSNLREALTAQWNQPHGEPPFLRKKIADLGALAGLGLALLVSFGITGAGTGTARQLLSLADLDDAAWARVALTGSATALSIAAMWLVFIWVIARLPREPVGMRSAVWAGLIGAIGFEALKQAMTVYLRGVLSSPAGVTFGPIIGLLLFSYLVSRFVLFLTAWAATARDSTVTARAAAPGPAVIQPRVQVRNGPGAPATVGVFGLGAFAGLLMARFSSRGSVPRGRRGSA